VREVAGWYGAAAIVLAYALVSFGVLSSEGVPFQVLNLTGAVGLVVISLAKKARQPAYLNMFWAVIALVALARILFG
jgi:hypothetical protein